MFYQLNRKRAQFKNVEPTMTDQSQAKFTDINIIVERIRQTGIQPPGRKPGYNADLTQVPEDLRGFLELARSANQRRGELPPQLQQLTTEQLLSLTTEDIKRILTPPEPPAPPDPKT